MFLNFNLSSEFLLISIFSCFSQIHSLLNMIFSVIAELSNISSIMLITSLIVLFSRICSSFIMFEVSEDLGLS